MNKNRTSCIGWLALGVLGLCLLSSLSQWVGNVVDRIKEATYRPNVSDAFSHAAGYANLELATYKPEPLLNPGCEHRPEWYKIGVEDLGNGRYSVEGKVITGNVYCVKDESYFTATVYYQEKWYLSGDVTFTNSCVIYQTYKYIPDHCFFTKLNRSQNSEPTATSVVPQLQESGGASNLDVPISPSPTNTVTSQTISEEIVMGEVGRIITGLTQELLTVSLNHSFTNPVVIAQPPSYEGTGESVVRITDVQNDSFTMFIKEAPNRDGIHEPETVSYLVIETGCWQLPGDSLIQVGSTLTNATVGRNISNHWEYVTYGLSFSEVPIIFSQVQTMYDPNYVKTKYYDRTPFGFQLALEEEEASTTSHQDEIIGWVAIESQDIQWNDTFLRVSQTPLAVGHEWYRILFGSVFKTPPLFLASTQSYNGKDNSQLRFRNTSGISVEIMIEEDTTFDTEILHQSKEIVGYLAFANPGTLRAHQVECSEQNIMAVAPLTPTKTPSQQTNPTSTISQSELNSLYPNVNALEMYSYPNKYDGEVFQVTGDVVQVGYVPVRSINESVFVVQLGFDLNPSPGTIIYATPFWVSGLSPSDGIRAGDTITIYGYGTGEIWLENMYGQLVRSASIHAEHYTIH